MMNRISAWSTRRKVVVWAIVVLIFLMLVGIIACDPESSSSTSQEGTQTTQDSTSVPTSAPAPIPSAASKFDCRELELEYQNMAGLGYNTALQHVSNVMSLKDPSGLGFYTSGDAEKELKKCGVISTQGSASAPTSAPVPIPSGASKFDCRELELEYQNMAGLGYNTALQHVSNVMSLKDPSGLAFYTSGDAEKELKKCGVIQ